MKIKIHFFSALRELMYQSEIVYECPDVCSCEDIVNRLKKEYEIAKILDKSHFIKNGVHAFRDTLFSDGDELTILPLTTSRR